MKQKLIAIFTTIFILTACNSNSKQNSENSSQESTEQNVQAPQVECRVDTEDYGNLTFSSSSFFGFIDKYPIELVTDIHSDDASGVYVYSNYDEPIEVKGTLKKGKLTLYEKDNNGKNKAALTFENFDAKSNQLEGTWIDLNSKKQLKISLKKNFDIDSGEEDEWKAREIIQSVSLKDKYFKLIISKEKGYSYPDVIGVKIFEKKTDKLIQQINGLECEFRGVNNISVGDYNFDGIDDFSVFEQGYSGPNTSSLYFLYNPQTNKYFDSGFSGISLEFDSKKKRIYEWNQSQAGAVVTTAEYKVVNNKMVLVEEKCFIWDEEKQERVERPMEECR